MKGKIFISYRREDDGYAAQRVYNELVLEFGKKRLFIDTSGLLPGLNFVDALEQELAHASVLLAVIGPSWLNASRQDGTRRLDNPGDYVRAELAAALKRNIPVIPICLDGAAVPKPNQLPEDIQELAHRGAVFVRLDSFDADVRRLIQAIGQLLALSKTSPNPTTFTIAMAALLSVVVLGFGGYFYKKSLQTPGATTPLSSPISKETGDEKSRPPGLEPSETPVLPGYAPPWLQEIRNLTGTHWGPEQPKPAVIKGWEYFIKEKYPDMASYLSLMGTANYYDWSGLTAAYSMARVGIRPPFGVSDTEKFLWAQGWLNFGTEVTAPRPGDVMVFYFGSGTYHVALFESIMDSKLVYVIGGNQTHEVKASRFDRSKVIGIRRPAATSLPVAASSGECLNKPDGSLCAGSLGTCSAGSCLAPARR